MGFVFAQEHSDGCRCLLCLAMQSHVEVLRNFARERKEGSPVNGNDMIAIHSSLNDGSFVEWLKKEAKE